MKLFFTIVAAVTLISLSSCGTTMYQLNTDCSKLTKQELLNSLTTLVLQEGFTVKQSDANLGLLQAETESSHNAWTGGQEKRVWTFQVQPDGKIVASAKHVLDARNAYGATYSSSETYYNDNVHSDWTWYWNVRNGIETLCGNKVTIIERKIN